MKKIININLASRLIPIEDSAYEILRQYLDSLKKYFAREEGADEIVSDIEGRIAEIFQDKIKKGAHCITDDDVVAVKAVMGTPDQFEESDDTSTKQQSAPASDPIYDSFRSRKRLYRDPDSKVLGGVCGGLGAYLNVDPVVFRIIFALLAIGGFGSGFLVYCILWIVTPEANSSAEKLQMRGERVDVNNIKAAVQDEINATKAHFKHLGSEMRNFSQGRGRQVGNDIERFGRNFFDILGRVLIVLTKGFFYFLAVVILLVLLVVGVMITVASPVLLPFKDLLLSGTLQNMLFWPSVFLLIGIPIVAIIIFIIRKLTGVKQTSRYVGYTLSFLWFTGLVFAILVGVSVAKDFRLRNTVKENFDIVQPSKGRIVFKEAESLAQVEESFFDENLRLADDTVIINNYRVSVEKSNDDKFYLEVQRSSRGRSMAQARTLAQQISFPITQQDTVIYLPAGISIPRNSKFRDQRIRVVIRVPVNKQVEMDRKVRNHYRNWNFDWDNDFDNHSWDDYEDGDHHSEVIKMTTDGVDQKDNNRGSDNDSSSEDNYRYKGKQERNNSPVEDTTKAAAATGKGKVAFEGGEAISYSLYKLLS